MTTPNSISIAVKEITAQNLNHVIDQLKAGEEIRISKLSDGTVNFSIRNIVGGKAMLTPVRNRTVAMLSPLPVKPGWMSFSEVPTDKVKQITKDRAKLANHKQKALVSAKELMRAGLGLVISFMDMDGATVVKHSLSSYWCFNVGSKVVYCNQNKTPVMYKDGERGELVYL